MSEYEVEEIIVEDSDVEEQVIVEEKVVVEEVITFNKLNDNLYIPLKNGAQIYIEFQGYSRSAVIESYNNLIMYIDLNTEIKDKIKLIEEQIKVNLNDENGEYKPSIIKNTNVGIYKLYKKKDKICAEIKTKANRNMLYKKIKSQKKYNLKLVLDYIWKKENTYGYSWNIHKIQEL